MSEKIMYCFTYFETLISYILELLFPHKKEFFIFLNWYLKMIGEINILYESMNIV